MTKVRILHLRSDLRLQKCSNRDEESKEELSAAKRQASTLVKAFFLLSAAVSHLMLSDLASSWQLETPCKMRLNKAKRQR